MKAQMKHYSELVETPQRIKERRTDYAEKVVCEELGEEYAEYRKIYVKASKREIVTEFPLYIQIEHSAACNLRCPTCIQGTDSLRKEYTRGLSVLPLDTYARILKEASFHKCPSISFHNNCEPLLLNDMISRIKLAKRHGFLDIIITTNATLLDEKKAGELLHSGVTKINFSVDAGSEKVYREVRKGGDFNTVVANIERFLELRKKHGLRLPVTRATCVISKNTYKHLDEFKEFWEKRVDVVEFQHLQVLKGYTEGLIVPGSAVNRDFACNAPWQQLVIRPNGDILPCCSFYGYALPLGNLKSMSLHEAWHSPRMKEIRENLYRSNFSFSDACKNCSENNYVCLPRTDR